MNWNRIRTTARWEYLRKVREKGFIISLILTPLFMIGSAILPALLASSRGEGSHVGVVDETDSLAMRLKSYLESTLRLDDGSPVYVVRDYPRNGRPLEAVLAAADSDALVDTIKGTIIIRGGGDSLSVSYRSPNPNDLQLVKSFKQGIEAILMEQRLVQAGLDTATYRRIKPDLQVGTVKVTKERGAESSDSLATFLTAFAAVMLLFFLIMTTGQSLVRSLVEEKSNRIMELLVSSSSPSELMWGKLIGLSGLGLTQIGIWMIIVLGIVNAVAIPAGWMSSLKGLYSTLPLLLVYVGLGYFFYSAIFIGLGSLVTTEQEAQNTTQYLLLVMIIPTLIALERVIQNPDAPFVRVLSYIPLMTPSMMIVRSVIKMPPLWELVATIVLMLVSIALVVWGTAKIFRTAILLQGKRPSVREVMRWLKKG